MSDHHSAAADTSSSNHHTVAFDNHTMFHKNAHDTIISDNSAHHTQQDNRQHHHHQKNPSHSPPYRDDPSLPDDGSTPSYPPPTYGSIVTIADLERQSDAAPRHLDAQMEEEGYSILDISALVLKGIFLVFWLFCAGAFILSSRRATAAPHGPWE